MDRKRIDQAAAQAGIAADFINAHGKRQRLSRRPSASCWRP